MQIIKSIQTSEFKASIEQHHDLFLIKYQETDKELLCTKAISNLTLVLEMFEKLVGKNLTHN